MQILRFADLVVSRWKNGGGTTREYLVHPPGAGTGDFFWRVSRAEVVKHGAFSLFPEVDRTLTVVAGDTIDLLFSDRRIRLDRTTPPYAFRGDVHIECRIPGEPIEDLNVMTRRGHWRSEVVRHKVAAPTTLDLGGDRNLIVAVDAVRVRFSEAGPIDLGPGDAIDSDAASKVAVEPAEANAEILVVRLEHLARSRG